MGTTVHRWWAAVVEGVLVTEELTQTGSSMTWVVRPDPDLEDLIPAFLQNRKKELADIEKALSEADFEAIRRLAHTWKGICRPYGFVHLETLSRNLETAGEGESIESIRSLVEEIRNYLVNVKVIYGTH